MNLEYPRRHHRKTMYKNAVCADCGQHPVYETWNEAWYRVSQWSCGCGPSDKRQESSGVKMPWPKQLRATP